MAKFTPIEHTDVHGKKQYFIKFTDEKDKILQVINCGEHLYNCFKAAQENKQLPANPKKK